MADMNIDAIISQLWIYISANAATPASTFNLRKNSGNATVSVSITALTTGEFQDTTNSETITPTDEVNLRIVNGGAGALVARGFSMLIENTTIENISTPTLLLMGIG